VSATNEEFTRMYELTPYPGHAGSRARQIGQTNSTVAMITARIKGMFFRCMLPQALEHTKPLIVI
jgi:hypothetical protein